MIGSMSDARESFLHPADDALVTLALSLFSCTQEICLPDARRSQGVHLACDVRHAVEGAQSSMITGRSSQDQLPMIIGRLFRTLHEAPQDQVRQREDHHRRR
jgi:hypothetical protein